MPSNILTNQLSSPTGVINIPSGVKIQGTAANSFSQPHILNDVVQVVSANTAPAAGVPVTLATELSAPLTASITPVYSTSKILVEFWSSMMLGSANILYLILYRQIDGGSYVNLTPNTKYNYFWTYNNCSWGAFRHVYNDLPATTGVVTYTVNYRNNTASGTNYVVHPHMEYGWNLYEIRQ